MGKTIMSFFLCFSLINGKAQSKLIGDSSWTNQYRYTPTRINDLVHTKLEISFDFDKSHVLGKAWITLTPHFKQTDSLTLDAKGMDIHEVNFCYNNKTGSKSKPVRYEYDGLQLKIRLPKNIYKGEKYTVNISYVAKPNEYEESSGLDPMLGAKGLFFINPKGLDKNKPTQIWTQGETESNSVWFPTIDQTQQKCTEEIYLTIPDKYVSLSNGILVSQIKRKDGLRTDYWKMDQPHSPYLFFIGVGEYAIVRDKWRGKEVNYYVEKEYASVARKIFGNTPEMMTFFSKITGVDFPWVKYSQITGRDYVAGAMENTTATIHQETAQQDARALTDGNIWEGTIAHELFHQWFGDYVTAESWSNLTLNESFADYSQTLWALYKYGKDAGDEENEIGKEGYLGGDNSQKNLVRFYYADRENMFDGVSYQKGGRILHMLRNYLGDSAFFKGLNLYLSSNKYKSAEAHHLRLALEEISGEDLNWFFNQWYFGNGHPVLDIQYSYDEGSKKANVIVKQLQKNGITFKIPTFIDIYENGVKSRHYVWIEHATDTFSFSSNQRPDLINFDGDKVLLCEKKENKLLDEYIYQYKNAGLYLDRREAIEYCSKMLEDPKAVALLKSALKDPFEGIRKFALSKIDSNKDRIRREFKEDLIKIAENESNRVVKALAIEHLSNYELLEFKKIFEKNIYDSSYYVSGASLQGLFRIDSTLATKYAIELSKQESKGKLSNAINMILIASGNEEAFDKIAEAFNSLPLSDEKFEMMQQIANMANRMSNETRIKKAIDLIISFRNEMPGSIKNQTDRYINEIILADTQKKLKAAGRMTLAQYIDEKK